ncbi:MAG: Uma2 family endonuclease [Anaerolineae bacterium]
MAMITKIPPTEQIERPQPEWLERLLPGLEALKKPNPDLDDIAAIKALELPGDDGEPMENERERLQINLILESLDHHWADRSDFYAGGNMFVYYSSTQVETVVAELADPSLPRTAFRGPDVFVVLDVDGSYRRQTWVVWMEEGRYPDVIFEFLSPNTRHRDLGEKKDLYKQTFGTAEYFCFEYMNPDAEDSLQGWRLNNGDQYQPIKPDERGWMWSEQLELWVGQWHGIYARDETAWLRFYTPDGALVLTRAEAANEQAEAEHQRAEAERQRAEAERQRAEAERQRAEAVEAELARIQALLQEKGIALDE